MSTAAASVSALPPTSACISVARSAARTASSCQWHGASFDMASGGRLEGPAPKGSRLMFLSTRVEDGALNYVWGE
ncbi:hypothetical protein NKI04_18970 [Mesorhizobium sp. M0814]